ncbi:uncharacterized protein yc1106_01272 [Curvularia clavata]|uniref:TauD/TfdA-like domain-containing protein n=1 Tax=Curvularia clavata TaxID=95742 RepID=A0A9Q8Z4X1_CURCL|nr:uncharacterized protein yc1106_01272 [Curvularia clavata]
MSYQVPSTISSHGYLEGKSSFVLDPSEILAPAVSGSLVWQGDELSPTDLIRQILIPIPVTGLPRAKISTNTFALSNPDLVNMFSSVSRELHHGKGVTVLRGLDSAHFNDEEAVIAFAGVCSYICQERATDSYANQTLSHILDATKRQIPEGCKGIGLAGSKVTSAMDFHSDRFSGDVIALHVRNDGGSGTGGEQFVASFPKIYNELLKRDPGVLETMAEPNWPFELKKKDGAPYLELGSTLFFSKGKPICQLVKAPLLGTSNIPRDPSMPQVTKKQLHAVHVVEELARQFCTKVDRQQGDIQLFHNLSIMHARTEYYGAGDGASARHLLRMFLHDSKNAWDKPARCRWSFDDPFTSNRPQSLPVFDTDPWRAISGRESHG